MNSHSSRHKMFIGSIGVLLVAALGVMSYVAVHSVNDHDEAVKLLHSGLDLLANGKTEEGMRQLEIADSKSPHVCQQLTNNWGCNGPTWNSDNLAPELSLTRLEGIRVLRFDEPWVVEERAKLLHSLSRTNAVIDLQQRQQNPWYFTDTTIAGISDVMPTDAEQANLLWTQNRKAEAVAKIDRAVALYPWNKETRALAQKIYNSQKQFDKLRLLEKRNLTADEQQSLASSSTSYNDESRADNLEAINKILAVHPWCATALICRSAFFLEAHQPAKAKADANSILTLYPGLAEGHVRLAKVYEQANDGKSALKEYEAALKSMPHSSELISAKCTQAKSLKLADKVLQAQNETIALEPNNIDLYKEKAEYLQSINRFKDAEAVVDQAIPIARFQQRCRKLLSYGDYDQYTLTANSAKLVDLEILKSNLRESQNDNVGAVATIDLLLKELPDNMQLRDQKTQVLIDAKKFEQALASVNEAIEKQEPSITVPLVGSFTVTNNIEDASALYELPSGGRVSSDAMNHLEKRIEIYQGLKDRTNELKDRHSLLQLKRLSITDLDSPSQYLWVLQTALELPNRDVALNVVDRLCKQKKVVSKADIKSFCEEVQTSEYPDTKLVAEVIDRLESGLTTKFPLLSETRAAVQALQ